MGVKDNLDTTKLLKDVSTLAVVCMQWGDTGKGKFVDWLAEWADIIIRGTGGANAGHTICLGDETHIFHLVPCGVLHDSNGKLNLIGRGVAFDPQIFMHEVNLLHSAKLSTDGLFVSHNARLVMPQHYLLDRLRESRSEGKIGTTGRGIGPAYVDHYARVGLTVNDLLNVDQLHSKLERNLTEKRVLVSTYDPQVVTDIMAQDDLGNGVFWNQGDFNTTAIVDAYISYGRQLADRIRDIDQLIRESLGRKNILLEGAQGNMLSVDHGSYPYVTASDCSLAGLAHGSGLSEKDVDLTLGIIKVFYMTRVGAGPFPTEMGGQHSEQWCASPQAVTETDLYPAASVNSSDSFVQGIGIRQAGGEYGATTGRPRRVGWLDLPLLRYSKQFTGHQIILTKIDVLDDCAQIKICDQYIYSGPDYHLGGKVIKKGQRLSVAVPDSAVLRYCEPVYKTFDGWLADTTSAREVGDLPGQLLNIIGYVEKSAGVKAVIISVGPDREQTIIA